MSVGSASEAWPALPVDEWASTRDTFQLWTQIVGKIRLARHADDVALVERAVVRHRARAHDVDDPRWKPRVSDRFRFRRPRAHPGGQRG